MTSQSNSHKVGSSSQTSKPEQTNAGPIGGASGNDRDSNMIPRSEKYLKAQFGKTPEDTQKVPKPANIFEKCMQPFNKNDGGEKQRKKELKEKKRREKEFKRGKKQDLGPSQDALNEFYDMGLPMSGGADQRPGTRTDCGKVRRFQGQNQPSGF